MQKRHVFSCFSRWSLLVAAFVVLAAPSLRAATVDQDIRLGDKIMANVMPGVTIGARFFAVTDTVVTIKVNALKGSTVAPGITLKDEADMVVDLGDTLTVEARAARVVKFEIPATGTYTFEIDGGAGSGGFKAKTKGKFPSKLSFVGDFAGAPVDHMFDVVADTQVKVKIKKEKGTDLVPTVESLTDEGGDLVLRRDSGWPPKKAISETGGTVTLTVGGTGTGGYTAKVNLKAPKSKELFDLTTQPLMGTLSGTVLDRNGAPVAGAEVVITSDPVTVTTAADGTFSAEVESGEHSVVVTASDGVVIFEGTVTVGVATDTPLSLGYVTYDPASDYVGKLTCKKCHSEEGLLGDSKFEIFSRSGHGFKLNPVIDGQMPTYPFSDIMGALGMIGDDGEATLIDKANGDMEVPGNDTQTDNQLGTPLSYDDITFVIGGFGWKARFIDRDGYIVTGSAVQYNLDTQGVVAYHDGETNKPYDCGRCHTTGWQSFADNGGVNQDGLPGIHGTFEFPAIECEQCHGTGRTHATAPSAANIVKDSSSELCGDCHMRDSQHRIAASGGLVRHHEQFDEMIRLRINATGDVVEADGTTVVPPETDDATRFALAAQGGHYVATAEYPDGVGCNGCHDPHATTKFDAMTVEAGVIADCVSCHPDKVRDSGTSMTVGVAGAALECEDCHMPKMVKTALSFPGVGAGPTTGDIASHIFKIDVTQTEQFTGDGKLAFPYITTDFACLICHGGAPESPSSLDLSGTDLTTYTFHQ